MTTAQLEASPSYVTARQRAREDLLAIQGPWQSVLPQRDDESWRGINLSAVRWDELSELLKNHAAATATLDGPHSLMNENERQENLDRMAAISASGKEILHPEEPRNTPESFFRSDIFTMLGLGFSEPTVIQADGGSSRLTIRHSNTGQLSFPASIIRIPRGAEVTVLEDYPEGDFMLRSAHSLIIVEEGARLHYAQVRNDGENPHFHHVRFLIERDAYVEAGMLQSGGTVGKTFFQASILGPGSEFHGRGLFAGKEGQAFHLEMGIQHLADHTTSSLLFKTVLTDHAHTVFLGNLEIPKGIRKVNSNQLNHNLILSKRARAESRPWLVIRAEDVSCEHGATVGDLDEEALFFLQSRGLPENEARRLMIQGFFEEAIDQMPLNETEKEYFMQRSF